MNGCSHRVFAGVLAAAAGVCLGVGAAAVPAAAQAAVPKGLESFYNQTVNWYD